MAAKGTIMAAAASATAEDRAHEDRPDLTETSDWGGLISFLVAGAILFAGLIVGSSASLLLAGGNQLIAAILEGFLELGLWTFGGFLAAVTVTVAMSRRRA